MSDLDAQKQVLRREVRARMPRAGSEEHARASRLAQERLAASRLAAQARVVGVYRSLPGECGTGALVAALEAAGKRVCYPVILPGRVLEFRGAGGGFSAGALGIEEPTGAAVPLGSIDLLVVPALAVDLRGGRLGRGKGYYDATLDRFQGTPVALVFDAQIVDAVPSGAHDRQVRAICTETRLIEVPA